MQLWANSFFDETVLKDAPNTSGALNMAWPAYVVAYLCVVDGLSLDSKKRAWLPPWLQKMYRGIGARSTRRSWLTGYNSINAPEEAACLCIACLTTLWSFRIPLVLISSFLLLCDRLHGKWVCGKSNLTTGCHQPWWRRCWVGRRGTSKAWE
jgi:hypothetical protein